MKKISLVLILLMFSFSLASACGAQGVYYENDWDNDKNVIFVGDSYYSNSNLIYLQENEDRLPAYSYRDGYSYRLQNEYYENKIISQRHYENYRDYYFLDNLFSGKRYIGPWQTTPNKYYEYVDYLDKYEEHECYSYPPKDKLLYVKC